MYDFYWGESWIIVLFERLVNFYNVIEILGRYMIKMVDKRVERYIVICVGFLKFDYWLIIKWIDIIK